MREQPAKATGASNLRIALMYAEFGIPVFPCSADKRPLLKEWLASASADEQVIRRWWQAKPDALIGLPLKPLDLVVIDADRHKQNEDGIETLHRFAPSMASCRRIRGARPPTTVSTIISDSRQARRSATGSSPPASRRAASSPTTTAAM